MRGFHNYDLGYDLRPICVSSKTYASLRFCIRITSNNIGVCVWDGLNTSDVAIDSLRSCRRPLRYIWKLGFTAKCSSVHKTRVDCIAENIIFSALTVLF